MHSQISCVRVGLCVCACAFPFTLISLPSFCAGLTKMHGQRAELAAANQGLQLSLQQEKARALLAAEDASAVASEVRGKASREREQADKERRKEREAAEKTLAVTLFFEIQGPDLGKHSQHPLLFFFNTSTRV